MLNYPDMRISNQQAVNFLSALTKQGGELIRQGHTPRRAVAPLLHLAEAQMTSSAFDQFVDLLQEYPSQSDIISGQGQRCQGEWSDPDCD